MIKENPILKDQTVIFADKLAEKNIDLGGVDFKTITSLCKYIDVNENAITITPSKKKHMAESSGVSEASIADSIRKLCKLDILYKVVNNYYLVNPEYICKGSEDNKEFFISYHNKLK